MLCTQIMIQEEITTVKNAYITDTSKKSRQRRDVRKKIKQEQKKEDYNPELEDSKLDKEAEKEQILK